MSDIKKTTDIGATTLTAADTFRESYSLDDGDVETGTPIVAPSDSSFNQASTQATQAATKKRRLAYFVAGTAALLIIIGLVVGLPKGSGDAAVSSTTAAAAPSVPSEPNAPVVIGTFVPPSSSGDEPAVVVQQPAVVAQPAFDVEAALEEVTQEIEAIEEAVQDGATPTTEGAEPQEIENAEESVEQAPSTTEDNQDDIPESNFEPQVTIGDAALLNPDYVSVITSSAPTVSPTAAPSAEPTSEPTAQPTSAPSASPSSPPTSQPTSKPTNAPIKPLDLSGWATMNWNVDPTFSPSGSPTPAPSNVPTSSPTTSAPTDLPTASPTRNPYFFGEEYVDVPELGIRMSKGLTVRLIAQTGQKVETINGDSKDSWHTRTDAAGIVPMDPNDLSQGYVYMSNSEEGDGGGGVYGLYFDANYNVLEYKSLLEKTTDNCGGGLTPWNTWVSCEEFSEGQCWQIDPVNGVAKETKLGGNGGRYESVAVDNRKLENPIFFTTEDDEEGALRRFIADGNGFDALHRDPVEETFLNILGDGTFEWTTDEGKGRESASKHFPKSEGIQFHEGKLYFMPKEKKRMYILDTDNMTYTTEGTGKKMYGEGDFGDQPDQNLFGPTRKYMYFTEDGGCPGVFARYGEEATYFTMFEATDWCDDETVGIAYSPDHMRFYAAIQDIGLVMEFAREDGLPFE